MLIVVAPPLSVTVFHPVNKFTLVDNLVLFLNGTFPLDLARNKLALVNEIFPVFQDCKFSPTLPLLSIELTFIRVSVLECFFSIAMGFSFRPLAFVGVG